MPAVKFLTITQQVAKHLREEISRGALSGTMPGRTQLAADMGVNHKTVDAALHLLKDAGLIVSQGAGRSHKIIPPADAPAAPSLRIGLILWAPSDRLWGAMLDLQHRLSNAGHRIVLPRKTLVELKMNVPRIARVIEQNEADAWVVVAGSFDVLQWFSQQKFPTFAVYGHHGRLPIAAVGTMRQEIIIKVIRRLIELGHRRMVMLVRRQHRLPDPVTAVVAFLEIHKAHGIPTSPFNLPDWEETPTGFQKCLAALFQVSPPSALIVDEPELYVATCHFLARRGIRVPQDVSLVCMDDSPVFESCVPAISCIRMDSSKIIPPILRWADHVSQGQKDIQKSAIRMDIVSGGTIGPAP